MSGADRRLRGPADEEHLPRRRSPRCPRRRRIIYGDLKFLCDGDLRYRALEKDHGGFLLCNMWPARVSSYEGTTGRFTQDLYRERTRAPFSGSCVVLHIPRRSGQDSSIVEYTRGPFLDVACLPRCSDKVKASMLGHVHAILDILIISVLKYEYLNFKYKIHIYIRTH